MHLSGITHEDVTAALKHLKRNKAADVDGIRAEFILDGLLKNMPHMRQLQVPTNVK